MARTPVIPRTTLSYPLHRLQSLALGLLVALGVLSAVAPTASAQRATYQFVATFDQDEKLQGQLERLKQLTGRKAWGEWVTLYQQLLDERPDGVVPQDAERFVGLRVHLERLFAQLPAEARQLYRTRYDAEARPI